MTHQNGSNRTSPAETLDRFNLPIHGPGVITDTPVDARDATRPEPTLPLRPPAGAPNVLIVLIDDMGFGASSAFGGPCEMPTAERIAEQGLQFTRFHNTSLCSPTRQALLTGRNHHTVNMGIISELATSFPGYTGIRPDSCVTIAQTLRMNGYSTGAFGKMHQTPPWETSPSGPFDRWPTGDGFEKFYGFLGGDCSQYAPPLFDGLTPIDPPGTPEEGYHLSEDLVDQAISWTRTLQALTPDKPWFTYLSFGATHAPHQAPAEWIEKYRGAFDHGHDKQREITFARQKELGVIAADAELTTPTDWIPLWDDLSDDDRKVAVALMEAYAGFASHTDHQVGRLIDALEALGVLDNTLVFYILGDNGASAEAGPYGTFNEMAFQNNVLLTTDEILPRIDEIGSPTAFNHFTSGWAHAMNTPYQWSKAVASHWGGTRTGMVARWPRGFQSNAEKRHQFHHVIDIVPTILEAAGLPAPHEVNGVEQKPMEGVSMSYLFDNVDAPDTHVTQYFEMAGNRGIYHDGWSAVTMNGLPWPDPAWIKPDLKDDVWELYAPDDWTQARNIAAENPEKLRELQDRFLIEAAKYSVLPIDTRERERFDPKIAGRADLLNGRTSMTLYPGMERLNENTVPSIKNTSFTISAGVNLGDERAEGAVIAQGGRFGGWSLWFDAGVPVYSYNFIGLETTTFRSPSALGAGDHMVTVQFDYDGGGLGKGGMVTLTCDGDEVASGRLERTVPQLFSFDDGLDVGKDNCEHVVDTYGEPGGVFTGTIRAVTIDVAPDAPRDHEMAIRSKFMKQ